MAHTPGPWNAGGMFGLWIAGPDGTSVADCNVGTPGALPTNREERDANARLIAAAPELADALRTLVKHLDAMTRQGLATCTGPAQLNAARAALTKVDGKAGA